MTTQRSATIERLRERAQLLAAIRRFFADRRVLEVETPVLSTAGTTDPAIDGIVAAVTGPGGGRRYLHTSPEHAMKRLLADGIGDCYQLCRVFRDGELGRWHQPEFTLLEWYRVGWTEVELMDEVADLLVHVLDTAGAAPRIERLSYADAFERALGVDPHRGAGGLRERLLERGVDVPAGLGRDALLDLALATVVSKRFARDGFTFVYDYPASQCALAEIKPLEPPVAARFELFAGDVELANGFRELTDAAEQARRFDADLAARRAAGRTLPPVDRELLAALERGLPACAGVAVGVDRLAAIAAGADGLAGVMSFVHGAGA